MKKEMLTITTALMLLIMAFSGCLEEIPVVEPKTIYVDDNGGKDYTSIQDAIDNALNGDTVFVYNGVYNEKLTIDKSIVLIGESKDTTIIAYDGGKSTYLDDILTITADNCTLKEFKIIKTNETSLFIGINIKSSNNTVSNNTLLNITVGVNIEPGSKNNYVFLNNISICRYGIKILHSYDNNITNNNISLGSYYGIYVGDSSEDNLVSENSIFDNDCGIRVSGSTSNEVFRNIVVNNQEGILLCCGADNNRIYHNTLKQNSEYNAEDRVSNRWDKDGIGNFWDDYNGTDADGDGIGDTPYFIQGDGNRDHYPLMTPYQ